MKKFMRSTTRIIMVLIIIVASIGLNETSVLAAAGSVGVSVSSSSIVVNNTFTVTVTAKANGQLTAAMMVLQYDTSYFSCSGYSGTIPCDYMESDSSQSKTWTYTFTALKVGSSTISIKDGAQCGDENFNSYEPDYNPKSVTVTVNSAPELSNDASLSSLSIGGATLSPAFSSVHTDYVCYVGSDVSAVSVVPTTTKGGACDISGNPGALNYGNNYVTITSHAPNGNTLAYTVNIIRSEPVTEAPTEAPTTEAPTTEAPTDPLPVVKATIGDSNKYVLMDLSSLDVPEGYKETTVTYSKEKVPAFTNETLGITLLYLTDKEDSTKGSYYIYDADTNSLFAYQSVKSTGVNYVMLEVTDNVTVPTGFTKTTTEILDKEAIGYVSPDNEEFVLFYAVNPEGSKGWYCYDTVEKTIQRYAGLSASEQDDDTKILLNNANDKIQSLNDKLDSVSTPFSSKTLLKCLFASLALLFVLICSTIYLLCRQVVKTSADEDDEIPDDGDDEFVSNEEAKAFDEEAQRLQMAYTDELKSEIESMSTDNEDMDDTSYADEEITATTEEKVADDYDDESDPAFKSDIDDELDESKELEAVDEKDELELDNEESKELHNEIANELVPNIEKNESDSKSEDVINFIDDIDESDDDLL